MSQTAPPITGPVFLPLAPIIMMGTDITMPATGAAFDPYALGGPGFEPIVPYGQQTDFYEAVPAPPFVIGDPKPRGAGELFLKGNSRAPEGPPPSNAGNAGAPGGKSDGKDAKLWDEWKGLEANRLIKAAADYHRGRMFVKGKNMLSRRQLDAAKAAARHHGTIANILDMPEEEFSSEAKRNLIAALHGPDDDARTYISDELRRIPSKPDAQGAQAIMAALGRLAAYGPPNEISLPSVDQLSAQHRAESEAFFTGLAQGSTSAAIVNHAHLPDDLPATLPAVKPPDEGIFISNPQLKGKPGTFNLNTLLPALGFSEALASEVAKINIMRRNIHEIGMLVELLRCAVDTHKFPIVISDAMQFAGDDLDDLTKAILRNNLPHGATALHRDEVEDLAKYAGASLRAGAPQRTEEHFPVVFAVPKAGDESAIGLAGAPKIDVYVRQQDAPRIQAWLEKTGLGGRSSVHPFIPSPEAAIESSGFPRYAHRINTLLSQISILAIEHALARLDEGKTGAQGGYPEERVEQTRKIHRDPQSAIGERTKNIRGGSALTKQEGVPEQSREANREFADGIVAILEDRGLPIEARVATADMMKYFEPTLLHFLYALKDAHPRDPSAADYGQKKQRFCRMLLSSYFRHFPWAEEVMVEEGLRREYFLPSPKPPFGIEAISAKGIPHARRFVHIATKLALVPEENVRRFMEAVAAIPYGSSDGRADGWWEKLGRLSSHRNAPAFEFVSNFDPLRDGRRLEIFLSTLEVKPAEARGQQFYGASIQSYGVKLPDESARAVGDLAAALKKIAPQDAALRWQLSDMASMLIFRLNEHLPPAEAAGVIGQIAASIDGWRLISDANGDRDVMVKDLIELVRPQKLSGLFEVFADALAGKDDLAGLLANFLARQHGNLSAIQHLLLAFFVGQELGQPASKLVEIFKRERAASEQLNVNGKIAGDTFMRSALLETFGFHFVLSYAASGAETSIISEFAARSDVAGVEILPETWKSPVPDLRVHPVAGEPYLVEIKTLRASNGEGFEAIRQRFRRQIEKAISQISAQHKKSKELNNLIIIVIADSEANPLDEDKRKILDRDAKAVLSNGGTSRLIDRIEIRYKRR